MRLNPPILLQIPHLGDEMKPSPGYNGGINTMYRRFLPASNHQKVLLGIFIVTFVTSIIQVSLVYWSRLAVLAVNQAVKDKTAVLQGTNDSTISTLRALNSN